MPLALAELETFLKFKYSFRISQYKNVASLFIIRQMFILSYITFTNKESVASPVGTLMAVSRVGGH